jgi:AcrR family transcriptional regulator
VPGSAAHRTYDSTLRQKAAAQTRLAIIEAARGLLSERGWSGTTIRRVAESAGVAIETVYSSVGGKVDLLSVAIDVGVGGDADPIPLRDRPAFQALGRGDRRARFQAAASLLEGIYGRTAGINRALTEAAFADARARELREQLQLRQRSDVGLGLRLVLDRAASQTEIDETWALIAFETYDNLVRGAGWTSEQYTQWLTRTLALLHPVTTEAAR